MGQNNRFNIRLLDTPPRQDGVQVELSGLLIHLLESLGFVVNLEKSISDPVKTFTFLGGTFALNQQF